MPNDGRQQVAAWTFQLFEDAAFEIEVNVVNTGPALVTVSEYLAIRAGEQIVNFQWVRDIAQLPLSASGRGVLPIPVRDDGNRDTVFSAYCGVVQSPGAGNGRWYWTLAVRQHSARCGLIPGQVPLDRQSFGTDGVRDPAEPGDYAFGSGQFDDSTIPFEVVAPPDLNALPSPVRGARRRA